MKLTGLVFITLGIVFAADKEPATITLTADQKAAIYKALYEQTQAQATMKATTEALTKILADTCVKGYAVGKDDKGELACVKVSDAVK